MYVPDADTLIRLAEILEVWHGDRGQTHGLWGMYLPSGSQGGRTQRVPDARLDLLANCLMSRIIYKICDIYENCIAFQNF